MDYGMTKDFNDLFFTCSLIDFIARKTKNRRVDVVHALGEELVRKIHDFADVYHCEPIEAAAGEFMRRSGISEGSFDNVGKARYAVPDYWDIGKVYARLVEGISETEGTDAVTALFKAYESPVSPLIDDYNSIFYCESPHNILMTYYYGLEG